MPEVFTHSEPLVEVGPDWLTRLKDAAEESPLRRARLCLHVTPNDTVQEMILVLCKDVLFQPHRHHDKTESFHIIEGEVDLIIFDEMGAPVRTLEMGPIGSGKTFCYRLNTSLYHALLPRTKFVVFHETTVGPFRQGDAEFAPWAPESPIALRAFLEDAVREHKGPQEESVPAAAHYTAGADRPYRDISAVRDEPEASVGGTPGGPTLEHTHPEPQSPERVVVLGGNGFLGRALLARLSQAGIPALALNSRDVDLTSPMADRLLAKRLRPRDALVMLAAVNPGRRHDEEAFLSNVAMASAVCRAVPQAGCAHLVYISSDAVYPFISDPVEEHLAPLPTSLYAHMHLARETMLRAIESVPVAVLRLTQVYGAGDPHNAYGPSRMIRSALNEGRIVLYGSGEETRDHIHVDEAAITLLNVLTMRSRGLVNVATGRSISFADLAELVRRICGGAVEIAHEARRMPVMHRRFDIGELEAAFPGRVAIPLEEGLAIMAERQRSAQAANSGLEDATDDYLQKRNGRSRVTGAGSRTSPAEALTATLSSPVSRNRSL